MTSLYHKEGNIFDSTAQALGHGVNTQGDMAAGIAAQFRDALPEMFDDYSRVCKQGDLWPGGLHAWKHPQHDISILNIASQEIPGANANYVWLAQGVRKALLYAEISDYSTIALPRIGSGIGGLDEKKVEGILLGLATSSPVDIELWTYKP